MDTDGERSVEGIKIPQQYAEEFVWLLNTAEKMSSSFNVTHCVESKPANNPFDTSPIVAAFPVEMLEGISTDACYRSNDR